MLSDRARQAWRWLNFRQRRRVEVAAAFAVGFGEGFKAGEAHARALPTLRPLTMARIHEITAGAQPAVPIDPARERIAH